MKPPLHHHHHHHHHHLLLRSLLNETLNPLHHLRALSTSSPNPRTTHVPESPPLPPATSLSHRHARSLPVSGSPARALHLLDEMPQPNLASYNLTLSSYNRLSRFDKTISAFRRLRLAGFVPDQFAYGSVLSACAASEDVAFGEQVYSIVLKYGFCSNGYVCTGMIDLFAKNGRFGDAVKVFEESANRENVVCWNAVIAGAVRNGENSVALRLFCDMLAGFCAPNGFTFSSVLCACAAVGELWVGRGVHALVVKCDSEADVFVRTAIVDLYAKCGDMDAAMNEFVHMPIRNVVSWTAIISGFVREEAAFDALRLFKEMIKSGVEINKCTVTSVLLGCSKSSRAKETNQIHCLTLKNGLYMDSVVKESLISTYAKIANFELSERVFEESGAVKSPATWSALITGLSTHSSIRSIELLKKMFREGSKPDSRCSSVVLSTIDSVELGKQFHSVVVKDGSVHDVLVGSALSTMYSRCGGIEDGYKIFMRMKEKDRVSWTSMISGFSGHGRSVEAFQLCREMIFEDIKPDPVALSAILAACEGHKCLIKGMEIHGYALRFGFGSEMPVNNALVSMYSKCKNLVLARRVFDRSLYKDQVMWSSMVSGYATNGYSEEALSQVKSMLSAGFELDHFSCSSILGLCANLSKPCFGRQLHGHANKAGTILHLSVSCALLAMYSKCGSIEDSRIVFEAIENPDLVTWTAMIDGYAQHGSGLEALSIFKTMIKHGMSPDSVTLVSVLSACSRNGLVEEGFFYFNSMRTVFGIEPESHHYACMVDLLSRSGRLIEAANFINSMPIKPNFLIWSTLLAASRVHGDVELGKLAARKVLEMENCDSGSYISLSHISADIGDWEEVLRIRRSMKGSSMKKEPGWSIT
ncbi:pentatricopeptide repeat-containing protein At1g74600, chloroplastic [Ananas comosus]|uniref:Pentatricopeptide repeat-containing protein At1g74600, chloroplastic n=1 Tax=Ananas comosus TaxID=4615 RepID=A0A6P5GY14_ANACO|nr:pentatricopeptide repeat-containing protein At1g74600, chloroplastic [Ananas comosus]